VDAEGNGCSLINSNYMGFGTGIVPEVGGRQGGGCSRAVLLAAFWSVSALWGCECGRLFDVRAVCFAQRPAPWRLHASPKCAAAARSAADAPRPSRRTAADARAAASPSRTAATTSPSTRPTPTAWAPASGRTTPSCPPSSPRWGRHARARAFASARARCCCAASPRRGPMPEESTRPLRIGRTAPCRIGCCASSARPPPRPSARTAQSAPAHAARAPSPASAGRGRQEAAAGRHRRRGGHGAAPGPSAGGAWSSRAAFIRGPLRRALLRAAMGDPKQPAQRTPHDPTHPLPTHHQSPNPSTQPTTQPPNQPNQPNQPNHPKRTAAAPPPAPQVLSNILDLGMDPQSALDAPRFCVDRADSTVGAASVAESHVFLEEVCGEGRGVRPCLQPLCLLFGALCIVGLHPSVFWLHVGAPSQAGGLSPGGLGLGPVHMQH
jgi:hypothetical protein